MVRRCLAVAVIGWLGCSLAQADAVTEARVAALSADQRPAWQAYLQRSAALAQKDQAALDAELAAHGITAALKAPNGGDFKLSHKPGDAWFGSDEAKQLADVVLSYQTPSGGWSKHTGYAKGPRQPGMQFSSQSEPGHSPHYLATFDNRSTTEQLHFLALVWQATGRDDCRAAFVKGLNFVFDAQYPTGGWPQVYPLEGGYHDDITFNDDATTHVLTLLQDIGAGEPQYAFLDADQRAKSAAALQAGIDCVLKTQVIQGGQKSVWCAQYDPITLAPTGARAFEPATLSGMESARILEMLMRIPSPGPRVVESIEAGLAWLDQHRVTDVKKIKVNGKTTYVIDPASTEIYWARFYDLQTGTPVFPGRDHVLYKTYAEMAKGNNIGYDYYTTLPSGTLNSRQQKWRRALAKTQPSDKEAAPATK